MATAPRENSLIPTAGRHCRHLFYRWNRARLSALSEAQRQSGRQAFVELLDPAAAGAPTRLQTFAVAGHKADFGLLALDADPLVLDGLDQRLMASPLGAALEPAWSFVSLTEVSEYVPTLEQYVERLRAEGLDPAGEEYRTKLASYERRLEVMQRQRLNPDLPVWPAMCFYPMNKKREVGENWFLLDFETRERLMREHGESGMKFAGRVTQLVTVALGLDDWEWGVTLWARNPEYLRDIVYRMRYDEASARYAQFGPFYTGYLRTPAEVLEHCRIE
jgi:chlorite dismutase